MALTPCRDWESTANENRQRRERLSQTLLFSETSCWKNCRNTGATNCGIRAMLARLHRNVAVEGRHLAMPPEKYYEITTWGQANDVWIQFAQELGEQALCRALHHAGLEPSELGALFFTSVTGISSPSIDALLINRMGLPANIRRVPIFGLGLRGGRCGNCARSRLRARLSIASGRAGFGRTLLADDSARRSFSGQSDFLGTVRRRLGSGDRYG